MTSELSAARGHVIREVRGALEIWFDLTAASSLSDREKLDAFFNFLPIAADQVRDEAIADIRNNRRK